MGHEVLGVHIGDRWLYPFQCNIGLLDNRAVYISGLRVHPHVIRLAASCHFLVHMNVRYTDLYSIGMYLPVSYDVEYAIQQKSLCVCVVRHLKICVSLLLEIFLL